MFICLAFGTQWRINFHIFSRLFSLLIRFDCRAQTTHTQNYANTQTHTLTCASHIRSKIIANLVNRRRLSLLFDFNVDGRKWRHQTTTTTSKWKKPNQINLECKIARWNKEMTPNRIENIAKKMFVFGSHLKIRLKIVRLVSFFAVTRTRFRLSSLCYLLAMIANNNNAEKYNNHIFKVNEIELICLLFVLCSSSFQ